MKKIDTNSIASIRAGIKSVANRSRTLQADIQTVALACLQHTLDHGDWTIAVEAIEGISASKGVKSSKLTQYFEAMLGATYGKYTNDQGNEVLGFVYDEGRSHKDINMDMAEAVKWYEFKADPKDNSKDLEQLQAAFLKMAVKAFEAGKITEQERAVINEMMATLVDARKAGDVVELSEAA